MGVYRIGEVIRLTRLGIGISQQKLCEGICSLETLSRIENGKRIPNRTNFQALMERMGKNGDKYTPYIHGDMELLLKREEISSLVASRRYIDAEISLNEFERLLDVDDNVNRQFILRMRALIEYRKGEIDVKEKRNLLIEALKCTRPNYSESDRLSGVFSRMEIMLLCNIAVTYAEEEKLDIAVEMLLREADYFNNAYIDMEERSISEVFVLTNLARCLGKNGDVVTAINIDKRIKKICIDYRKSSNLAGTLYDISYGSDLISSNKSDSLKILIQAYYVAELNSDYKMMNHINKRISSNYNKIYYNPSSSQPS